jgi:hypothetical protein
MAVVKFGETVSLEQFAESVIAVGDKLTLVGEGEPGIGKSSCAKMIMNRLGSGFEMAYIDCQTLDLGDFAMPYVEEVEAADGTKHKVTRFAPNARFKLQTGKPVLIVLDEIAKALKPVVNVLLTLLLERRIADWYLPAGSRVVAFTNLASDGVGDYLAGHARNRVACVRIGKPGVGFNPDGTLASSGWAPWAVNAGLDALLIAFVKQNPDCMASYTDGEAVLRDDRYGIWNPNRPGACMTPRSLALCDPIIKSREVLGNDTTMALLAGTVGHAGAAAMMAFFTIADKLPTWEQITNTPTTAKVPEGGDAAACCLLVLSAISRADAQTITPWVEYLKRLSKEWQALFCLSMLKGDPNDPHNPVVQKRQKVATSSRAFTDLVRTNNWMV